MSNKSSSGRNNYDTVPLLHPGHRTRAAAAIFKAAMFILLAAIGFSTVLPVRAQPEASISTPNSGGSVASPDFGSGLQGVGAYPLTDLSLPKPLISSANSFLDSGGVLTTTPQNLTLYNSAVRMRMLGAPTPHDVLLSRGGASLSTYSFWSAQSWINGTWTELLPISNTFTILGSNKTGSFVVRTMQVNAEGYSGILKIGYRALSTGPLKWTLDFMPSKAGSYRLVHLWGNLTSYQTRSEPEQFRVTLGGANYTLSWNDVPSLYSTETNTTSDHLSLSISLGNLNAGQEVTIDPSIVSSSTSANATAWSFQRKVFYEPKWGNYYLFYYNGSTVAYRYSHDGLSWSLDQIMPSGWPSYVDNATSSLSLYAANQEVIIATGSKNSTTTSASAYLKYSVGTISGHTITWGPIQNEVSITRYAAPGSTTVFGIRYVSVTASANGIPAFSYNWYAHGLGTSLCLLGANYTSEGGVFVAFNNLNTEAQCNFGGAGFDTQQDRSIVVPTNLGRVRLVYQFHSNLDIKVRIYSQYFDPAGGPGPLEIVESNSMTDTDEFSAVADTNYGTNVIYRSAVDNNITYAYRSVVGSGWTYTKYALTLLPNTLYYDYPTITVDYSTNQLYLFATDLAHDTIDMRYRTAAGIWQTGLSSFFAGTSGNPFFLSSNPVSASDTNSSSILLSWTQVNAGSDSVTFASIPIATAWSPYSSPSDPWDGNGIAPYGQYFSNLGESVSPSSGMLTIRQTDLSIPGRGIDFVLTRVYTEPYSFFSGSPYGYESFPWAPLGNGWQLNFPWMRSSPNASFIHLLDGQGYTIPSSFWMGTTSSFDNHQGEQFTIVRNATGIFLYTNSGIAYVFDSQSRFLKKITDPVGNNITFTYNGSNQISKIVDTVGRTILFCYTSGLLTSVEQNPGSCGTGFFRRIVYTYNGQELTSVSDPIGRLTNYTYGSSVPSVQNWLVTKITYPTHAYTNYSYVSSQLGTETTSYRVSTQTVGSGTSLVRAFLYAYTNGAVSQVSNSTVTTIDGCCGLWQTVSYTAYSFSFAGVSWNVSDGSHNFVRGELQRFGLQGNVLSDQVLVSRTQGYTNYYHDDLWGNQIYSRQVINPSNNLFHESFASYYNNGMPPSFYSFLETFQANQGTATDNLWHTNGGVWTVKNGFYNGTYLNGGYTNTFAWSNSTVSDISLQARIYISRQINSTGDIGLFVHYPGNGNGKWSMLWSPDFHNLFFEDESGGSVSGSGGNTCHLTPGAWSTFNFTVRGTSASGWAREDNGPSCGIHTGTFSATSPVETATNFGVLTGGFSLLFDNVTVSTATPFITTTGFSNSFYQKSPGQTIHNAVAGTAQFQNRTNTPALGAMESYYNYTLSGELTNTRSLYNSPSGTQWITSSRTYDTRGNPVQNSDQRGNVTYYSYASKYQYAFLTNQTRVLNPGSTRITSLYGYNFTNGMETWTTDPNGYNTTHQYDILGRITKTNYPNGLGYVNYSYNDVSNYVNITNENGWKTKQIYDGLGRLSTTDRFLTGIIYSNETFTYNWMDKTVRTIDALGSLTTYQYDPLGRLTETVQPDGNYTQTSYNDVSSLVLFTDQSGFQKAWVYDRLGRLIRTAEQQYQCFGGCNTNYYYDEVGNLARITNPTGQTTNFVYDNLNRLTRANYPDGTSESYTYDAGGNLVTKIDRNNNQTSHTYDSLNRVIVTKYYGLTVTNDTYTYDAYGNVLKLQSQNATLGYVYDSRNRVISECYSINGAAPSGPANCGLGWGHVCCQDAGYSLTYSYSGEVLSYLNYRDGLTLGYSYDGLGRVLNVTQSGYSNPAYAKFTYYKNDQVKGVQYGNGLVENYTYNSLDRPTREVLNNPSLHTTLLSLSYSYNKTGTVASVIGQVDLSTVNEQYRYDALQRLTNATVTSNGATSTSWYMYDSLGNRILQKVNGVLTNYTYNVQNNELTRTCVVSTPTACSSTITYTYTKNGSLNSTTNGSQLITYTWDVRGDLSKVANGPTVLGYYAYDGMGRRVEKVEGSSVLFYALRGTEDLAEQNIYGACTNHIFANGFISTDGLYISRTYDYDDALGSIRLAADANSNVVFVDGYQSFGQDNGTPTGTLSYRFTDKPASQATGLYYEYSRWYDPTIGRFISRDPLSGVVSDPQSQNAYVYVQNQPTTLIDPTGACGEGGESADYLCTGGSRLFPDASYWNYVKINSDVTESWIRQACADNPGLCGSFLQSGGYNPDDFVSDDVGLDASGSTAWSNAGQTPSPAGPGAPATPVIDANQVNTQVSLGPDSQIANGAADDATLVVRGGNPNSARFLGNMIESEANGGISAVSAPGRTAEELASEIPTASGKPYSAYAVTTRGALWAAGAEIVPDPVPGYPSHVVIFPEGGSPSIWKLWERWP